MLEDAWLSEEVRHRRAILQDSTIHGTLPNLHKWQVEGAFPRAGWREVGSCCLVGVGVTDTGESCVSQEGTEA